jgi:hypothetical protein
MKANRLNNSLMDTLLTIAKSYELPVEVKSYFRVDVVCSSTNSRAQGKEAMSQEKAEEVASWFGRTEDLHAEVVGPLQQMTITVDGGKDGDA